MKNVEIEALPGPIPRDCDATLGSMKHDELAKRLARSSRISQAAAADLLDRTVAELVRELRKGHPVPFPGLGTIRPKPDSSRKKRGGPR
jgi:nucleoid DNA-binding protein